jgi:hypothetical protein
MRYAFLPLLALFALTTAAQAQTQYLPPPQYDHPFDGLVIIKRAENLSQMRQWCVGLSNIACARWTLRPDVPKTCIIVLADNAEAAAPLEVIIRHERAHCNGWPAHHPR